MMNTIEPTKSHVDMINEWPSLAEFAEDIGVSYGTAKAMRRRGSVPSEYWVVMVSKAAEREIAGVTFAALAEAVAKQPEAAE
ncbi:MAG TPA: hypothetical protein VJL88_06915 [Nitrospira sp.]|nr:hypothetical protein [Nitrospira sp.]